MKLEEAIVFLLTNSGQGAMVTEIELGRRYYYGSSYRKLLIDKALFLGWLSFEDKYAPDYELDEKLKKVFGGRMFEYI